MCSNTCDLNIFLYQGLTQHHSRLHSMLTSSVDNYYIIGCFTAVLSAVEYGLWKGSTLVPRWPVKVVAERTKTHIPLQTGLSEVKQPIT